MAKKRAFNDAFNSAFAKKLVDLTALQDKWLKIINRLSALAVDCSVTVYRLQVGAADGETGVYAVSYIADGEAQALMTQRKCTQYESNSGLVTEEQARFYLDVKLYTGDRLVTPDGAVWQVSTCTPLAVGDSVMCYSAEACRVAEAEATAITGWLCLVIGDYGIESVSPSGLRYLALDEELSATAEAKDGYSFFKWLLNGEAISDYDAVTVEPQKAGVLHVLMACSWSTGELHVYPENAASFMESAIIASALQCSDAFPAAENAAAAAAKAPEDTLGISETLSIENS